MKDSFFKDDPYIGVNHDKIYRGNKEKTDEHNPNSVMDIQLFIHDPEPKFVVENKELVEEQLSKAARKFKQKKKSIQLERERQEIFGDQDTER